MTDKFLSKRNIGPGAKSPCKSCLLLDIVPLTVVGKHTLFCHFLATWPWSNEKLPAPNVTYLCKETIIITPLTAQG